MNYRPISAYYRERFGERVIKVPVGVASTCPNREGLRGMKVCRFCDVWGSAADHHQLSEPLHDQVKNVIRHKKKFQHARKYLVYFQSYTTSFSSLRALEVAFEEALTFPEVCGIVIATRPDCVSPAFFNLLNRFCDRTYVGLEFGFQSLFDHHLEWLSRGHSARVAIQALQVTREHWVGDMGVHLIFGLPKETDEEIIQTARTLNQLPVHSVKLHHLHVLENTDLAIDFREGAFVPVSLSEYARKVGVFLRELRSDIYIHRLAGYSSRWDELIAPSWTADKMKTHQFIQDYLKRHDVLQGQFV